MDKLSVKDYVELLSQRLPDLYEKTLQKLKDERINGRRASALNTADFHAMGIQYGDALDIIEFNNTFKLESQSKPLESSKPESSAQSAESIFQKAPEVGPGPESPKLESSAQSSQRTCKFVPEAGPGPSNPNKTRKKTNIIDSDESTSSSDGSRGSEDSDKDYSEIAPYFNLDELCTFQKEDYLKQKRTYEKALTSGKLTPMPVFMSRRTPKRNQNIEPTVKVSELSKNSGGSKSSSKSQSKFKLSSIDTLVSFSSEESENHHSKASQLSKKSGGSKLSSESQSKSKLSSVDTLLSFSSGELGNHHNKESTSENVESGCQLDVSEAPEGSGITAGGSTEQASPLKSTRKTLSSVADSDEPSKKKRKSKKKNRRKKSKLQLSEEEYVSTLPKYDIDSILLAAGDDLEEARSTLEKDGICFGPERKRVIRTLANHLYYKEVRDPLHVTVKMREGMACSFVNKYPLYKSEENENKRSWWRIFDASKPAGYLQNAVKTIFKHIPHDKRPRGGGGKGKVIDDDDSEEDSDLGNQNTNAGHDPDQEWMSLEMAYECNQKRITEGMKRSREIRRKWITSEGPFIADVLKKYPHLMSFDGEMVELDFEFIYPHHVSKFMKEFPSFSRGLREVEKENLVTFKEIGGDDGGHFYMLNHSKTVATPQPSQVKKGKKTESDPLKPDVSSLVTIVPENTNVKDEIKARRTAAKGTPVQPYLLGVAPGKDFSTLCIVLDDKCIMLGKVPLIKALDMLFKVFHVFNAHYPAGWRTFWEFVEYGIYGITPHKLTNKGKEIIQKVKLHQRK